MLTRRVTRVAGGPKDRKHVLGRKARLECNRKVAARRATRAVSGPNDRNSAWPQGQADTQ
eukprot:scaffold36215_cov36-Phaeocystis_antarctica.AAC.1